MSFDGCDEEVMAAKRGVVSLGEKYDQLLREVVALRTEFSGQNGANGLKGAHKELDAYVRRRTAEFFGGMKEVHDALSVVRSEMVTRAELKEFMEHSSREDRELQRQMLDALKDSKVAFSQTVAEAEASFRSDADKIIAAAKADRRWILGAILIMVLGFVLRGVLGVL